MFFPVDIALLWQRSMLATMFLHNQQAQDFSQLFLKGYADALGRTTASLQLLSKVSPHVTLRRAGNLVTIERELQAHHFSKFRPSATIHLFIRPRMRT